MFDGADQAGEIARGRRLAPPLLQWTALVAVEARDEDVVLDDQKPAEMEITVQPDVRPADIRWQ